jgi:2-polyprenyl-3-methyl-5-hydroxy-6-metoxy-1,4-benzoquinol methylase
MQQTRNIENYADSYSVHDFEDIQISYRKKEILKHFKYFAPNKVLEIGCGPNPFFTSDIDYKKYFVVEPSTKFSQDAKNINKSDDLIVINDFFENQVDRLVKEELDFIILSSLLHEVTDPKLMLNKIKEVATANTIIHINVPNSLSLHRLLAFESGIIDSLTQMSSSNIKLQQHFIFSMQDLISLVEEMGFEVVNKGSYFIKPFTHTQMSQLLDNNIIDKKVLDGFYNLVSHLPDYGSEIFVNVKVK